MKFFLLLVTLIATSAIAATAPDSIAGKVFRETGGNSSLRVTWELSISFGADGRYSFNFGTSGTTLALDGATVLRDPPKDGTYTYTRTTDTDASITLNEPSGTLWPVPPDGHAGAASLSFSLRFSTNSTGTDGLYGFSLANINANQSAPAINVALRGTVDAGRPLIAGFVIPGTGASIEHSRDVLIRVVGPGLSQFGVTSVWVDPDFQVYKGANPNSVGAHFGDWSQPQLRAVATATVALQRIFAVVGAFSLPANSKDAVKIARLAPGPYTIVASAATGDSGGETLIEVYFLP